MSTSPADLSGLVVAGFGRQVLIETDNGDRFQCRMLGRKIRPVCGDRITWIPLESDQVDGTVTGIGERDNVLMRPNRRGKEEPVAANLDQLIVVFSHSPPADPFLIDRYIAAAEHLQINCALIYNKTDTDTGPLPAWLRELQDLGYPVALTSAKSGAGLDSLRTMCAGGTSILVGQSGVGKSSLLNALLPGIHQETGALSDSGKFGRHTTSASYLYYLDDQDHTAGALIDSPGVRDFAPPPLKQEQVPNGYVEILAAAEGCRFSNCRHENEPDCGVKKRVADGQISARRYESYLQLMALMRTLSAKS
ncbi:MAG: ribosome small subunit-dependent GTPase A [Gammaproteobacteria bacterium]|nr:ribosome small subunit-dependent GTPase A [Gammaproteobacteria bacterium]